jgi:hypothetical protein
VKWNGRSDALSAFNNGNIPGLQYHEATGEKTRYRRGEWCIIVYNGKICSEAIEANDTHKDE